MDRFMALLSEDGNRHYPIQQTLCRHLDIHDIINLTRTCKSLESLYKRLVPLQWNLTRQLKRFVKDPLQFRQKLSLCRGLISGSFALQFFDRVVWPDSDMDLFFQQGREKLMSDHLTEAEGYRLMEETRPSESYASYGVQKVLKYHRQTDSGRVLEIQIVLLRATPILAVLRGFYMTAVVNFISCNKAYAMFPHQTFTQRRTYLLKPPSDHFGKLLAKYEARGWSSKQMLDSDLDQPTKKSLIGHRFAGDKQSWMINIKPTIEHPDIEPDSVLDCCNFDVAEPSATRSNYMKHLQITCTSFEHPALKYQYGFFDSDWGRFVAPRLDRLSGLEFIKCKKEQRPQGVLVEIHPHHPQGTITYEIVPDQYRFMERFQAPDSWTYYDHLMPGFVEEFQTRQREEQKIEEEKLEKEKIEKAEAAARKAAIKRELEEEMEREELRQDMLHQARQRRRRVQY